MKQAALFGAVVFSTLGAYLPYILGDKAILSGWSILAGTIGGFFGIWVGVKVFKALGL